MTSKHLKKEVKRRPSVFGIGLIALDLIISPDSKRSDRSWAGGTCGNVLTILSFLGWDAYPIARLNGDAASRKVKEDFRRWGVHLEYATCAPTCSTPIIVQEIRRDKRGQPRHKFSWACPHCGSWLPSFKPVTTHEIERITDRMNVPQVFFMDRLSRAALTLASAASSKGALVVLEISAKPDERLLREALQLSNVVKYSDERWQGFSGVDRPGASVLLEVQTLGARGLRYRSWVQSARSKEWKHLEALRVPVLTDTCGAGDWCTAGLIEKLGASGFEGLKASSAAELHAAFRYGQALAAWNCGFEGARGGMYDVDKQVFAREIRKILEGQGGEATRLVGFKRRLSTVVSCPACPPANKKLRYSARPGTTKGRAKTVLKEKVLLGK